MIPPNIVWIWWDAIRRDRLSYFGYKRETTPFVDGLAKEGWVFHQAISQSYWSPPSWYSMFTGLYPHQHGMTMGNAVQETASVSPVPQVEILPETLRNMGYDTWCVTGGSWAEGIGLARGFDHFYGYRGFYTSTGHGWGGRKVDRIKKVFTPRSPFFLSVGFRDIHSNYDVPAGFQKWAKTRSLDTSPGPYYTTDDPSWTDVECQEVQDRYDEAVYYEDHVTGQLISWLQDQGLMENTVVIVNGDHGEALCDRWFQDRYLFEHTCTLYDEIIKVPLVVWGSGFSHQDIAEPTELRRLYDMVMGIANNKRLHSSDLSSEYTLSWASYPKVIAQHCRRHKRDYDNPYLFSPKLALRSARWKYINVDRVGEELYDLQEDPGETQNIFDADDARVEKAKVELAARDIGR